MSREPSGTMHREEAVERRHASNTGGSGTKLHFKVRIAASGVTEPTILDCDATCDLAAPTSGSFYAGHALVVSDDKELTLSLKKADWHTVSFNVVPDDPSPAAVFADVADKVAAVTQGVNYWIPGKAGTLKAIEVGKGYWVKTTGDDVSWTVSGKTNPSVEIPLTTGWNLIGYAREDEEAVASVLKTALAEKAIDYVTYGVAFYPNGTLTRMSPGKAYWVHSSKASYMLVFDEVSSEKLEVRSVKMAAASVDAIVSIASAKDGTTSSDALETNASTGDRALPATTLSSTLYPLSSSSTPTYGPFGESEDVANPDKLGPTMFTDVSLTIDGEPAAVGDCVAAYRGDTGAPHPQRRRMDGDRAWIRMRGVWLCRRRRARGTFRQDASARTARQDGGIFGCCHSPPAEVSRRERKTPRIAFLSHIRPAHSSMPVDKYRR